MLGEHQYAVADMVQLEWRRNSFSVRCGLKILGSRSAGWEVEWRAGIMGKGEIVLTECLL